MKEINEQKVLNLEIRKGIIVARDKFEKYHNYYLSDSDIYLDIIDQIIISVMYYWEYNKIIDMIFINVKNLDNNLFNKLLNLIKNETYHLGLRIIRKQNCLYLYINKIINKNIYFVESVKEEEAVSNLIMARKK
ncbi:MAG: hypothetical protein IJA94_02260 [Bacilli bacterium]|nr:hypothetical protein [Bacilli bacterium]